MDKHVKMLTADAAGPRGIMLCLCCDSFVVAISIDSQVFWAWQVLAYSSHLF